jgi:hypothetical protein
MMNNGDPITGIERRFRNAAGIDMSFSSKVRRIGAKHAALTTHHFERDEEAQA